MDGFGMVGVIGLAAVLVLVAVIAVLRERYDGRLRDVGRQEPTLFGGLRQDRQESGAPARIVPFVADAGIALPAGKVTVVQFSVEFCAICPQARTLVQRVLGDHPDIAHVEVDVAEHLQAVRALDIRRTPTLVIVDEQGRAVHRASGMPREAELRQAVSNLAVRW